MMATTAGSAPNSSSHTPGYSLNSPKARSQFASSPWKQIAKGRDSEMIHDDPAPSLSVSVAAQEPSVAAVKPSVSPPIEKENPDNDNAGKKPVWNKPSNNSAEFGHVMGAQSWPSLSVSARVSSNKSPSSESLKGLSADGSSTMPPLLAAGSSPVSTPKQSIGGSSLDPNAITSTGNHNVMARKKPYKRNNSNAASSSGISNPSAPGNAAAPLLNTISPRDQTHSQRGGAYGGGNPHYRNSNRNHNNGGGPNNLHGDVVHHQSYGNRRNYDHGYRNAYPNPNFNGRDEHMQPRRGLGPVRPQVLMGPPSFPPGNSQYVAAPHLRPYGIPMVYPEYGSAIYMPHPPPESMALVGQFPPQPFYFPGYDPMLFTKIVKQVDFYFSADNLSKDKYLRQQMDDEGWVAVSLIASFKKLAELTNNIQIILEALKSSTNVEVQGESVRRRGDWNKYVWPRDLRKDVATHLQGMKLSEGETSGAVQSDSNKEDM